MIEDELHKATDLRSRLLRNGISESDLLVADSVREAVLFVESDDFDLVILDMALPTFSKDANRGTGGLAQASGGIEILRTLQALNKYPRIIIVTQYPELVINGQKMRSYKIRDAIKRTYGQDIAAVITYSYNTPEWEKSFDRALGG